MSDVASALVPTTPPETLTSFLDSVLSGVPEAPLEAYQYLEAPLQQLNKFNQDPDFTSAKNLLEGFSLQNQGLYVLSTNDFASAAGILQEASNRFRQSGAGTLADVTQGLQLQAQANVEIRQQNVEGGRKLIADAQKLLAKDPKMSLKYALLIDDCTFASVQIAAAQALQFLKFSEGRVLTEEASNRAEAMAHKYMEAGTPAHFLYLGLAKYWRAYFQLSNAQADLQIFSFQSVMDLGDLAKTAREARTLLTQATSLAVATDSFNLSGAFAGMLEVLPSIAQLGYALMQGLPAPPIDYVTLQAHLNAAKESAAAGGQTTFSIFRLCERTAQMIENLRRFDANRAQPVARPADPKTPIHLFVIMPFAAHSRVVEQALRAILEDEPYHFKLTLARDSMLVPNLLDNVKAHMYSSDAFIADISGLNPNVMMELGMVEGDPAKRPAFVLKRRVKKGDKEAEVPSDLKGKLYIEYDLVTTDSSDEQIRLLIADLKKQMSVVAELTTLSKRPHTRYTSAQYIQRKLQPKKMQLSDSDIKTLQDGFPSLEELESATPAQIAMKTGLDLQMASVLVSAFAPAAVILAP